MGIFIILLLATFDAAININNRTYVSYNIVAKVATFVFVF